MIDRLQENVRVHDRAARRYERDHVEIFNQIEQERVRGRLGEAVAMVRSTGALPLALDLGSGTGNLTAHLLALGVRVIAADVSPRSLEVLRRRFAGGRCETVVLGTDGLAPLSDRRFDVVAMYSVLHHVPDYARFLEEALALVRIGGVVYIDHEPSPEAWEQSPALLEWQRGSRTARSVLHRIRRAATPAWLAYRVRRLRNPRATLEGDIHVWPDDHVEWATVEQVLAGARFEIVSVRDHLQYRRYDDAEVYRRFAVRCADMRSLLARRVG